MTGKTPQIRVSIDQRLHDALQDLKMAARSNSGRRKPTVQSLIEAKLIKLHREQGFDSIINPNPAFPMVFAPPSKSDLGSISFALRVNDPDVYATIVRLSHETARPTAHILYSILRHVVMSSDFISAKPKLSA